VQKRLLALLAVFALLLAACGSTATQAPASESAAASAESAAPSESAAASESPSGPANLAADQVLRMDLGGEPPTLDPNMAQDSTSIAILRAITRPLTYFDKDLNIVPALAKSWDISADAKTITFHLQDGAKYSNGEPIVAGDLVYSWKRLLDPRTAAPYAYIIGDVAGAGDLLALAGDKTATDAKIQAALDKLGVSAPDDQTFVVNLSHPATYFLAVAANWATGPVQEKWITQKNATEAANYVGSGPFVLSEWDHNNKIVLKPNPNWYGAQKPYLTEIDYTLLTDPAAAQAAFEAGEADVVQASGDDIKRIQSDPTLGPMLQNVPELGIDYYGFNNKTGPMANKDCRMALVQSVDRDALLQVGWGGVGQVAYSIVPPGLPGYQPDLGPKYDVAAAKASFATCLSALGYSDVSKFPKLKFGYNSGAGHETRVQFIANEWKKNLGIQSDLQGLEWAVFLQKRHAGAFDVSRNAWSADYPNPRTFLNDLFYSTSGNNDEQYVNKDYDALIDQAAAEPDAAKQTALYEQAQTMLMNDVPIIPLRYRVLSSEVQPYVKGLPTAQDSHNWGDQLPEDWYLIQH
jgi:oligopeptide transport system substrate-binding protein